MNKIPFSKYSGCGNDFILVDNRKATFPPPNTPLIQNLCHRNFGIGADGLILLEEGEKAPFQMRVFNADGGEAEMCGNGLRCFGMFLNELGIVGSRFDVEVMGLVYPVVIESKSVVVTMVPPKAIEWEVVIDVENQLLTVDFLNTGVPHAVAFVQDIERVNFADLGPAIRYHQRFAPQGTNVDIAALSTDHRIQMRTYERGVEDETLACGTGSMAVAIAASRKYGLMSPIIVKTRSGEHLEFELSKKGDDLETIVMKGPAKLIYSGIVEV